ncbi:MAG: G8 domain-containing protein [Archaeoglobaceae archaeon]
MATLTSVKSGRWSDPTVWDAGSVPADGDSVTIASGHTVIFDVDQSSFTTGLAGLTINGTLFIPSQSEDSGMPDFVCLKVDANLNGSGTLQVGSETNRIQHPQKVRIMANGTLQVAVMRFYGELRRTWDWLKNTASSGSTTIVLANGIPLRQGDIIYIAGESSFHTVSSYDESTKTVTLTSGLGGTRNGEVEREGIVFPRCLVFLVSAQIEIVKYGSNNAAYGTGSGAVFEGVLFYRDPFGAPTAAGGYGGTFTNSVWNYCISYFMTGNDYSGFYESGGGSNNRYTFCTMFVRSNQSSSAWGWHGNQGGTPNSSLTDCAVHRPRWGISANRIVSYIRCYAQDCGTGIGYINPNGLAIFDGCVFIAGGTQYNFRDFIVKNCKFVNFGFSSESNVVFENCYAYYDGTSHVPISGGFGSVYKNITIFLNNASMFFGITQTTANKYENITVKGTASTVAWIVQTDDTYRFGAGYFRNCSIEVTGNVRIINTNAWSRYVRLRRALLENCSLVGTGQFLPAANFYLGMVFLRSCRIAPSYSRNFVKIHPATPVPPPPYMRCTNIRISGLEIGSNSYHDAEESLFWHGYVKNRWDTNPADPSTFEFYHYSDYVGSHGYLPVYIDFPVYVQVGTPIKVSGTISQLIDGEKVRVQIFRQDKEPLHWLSPDTPDYEVVFESVQSFSVNFVAPVSDLYFVRVQAEMNQTSLPVVVSDLRVEAIGEGSGGGGSGSVVINVSDSTNLQSIESSLCNLSISETEMNALTSVELLSVPMSLQLSENAEISSYETTQQMLSLLASDTEGLSVTELTNPTLSLSVADDQLVNASESLSQFLYPAIEDSVVIDSSESVGLPIAVSVSDQVTATTIESVDFESNIVFAGSDSASIVASEAASNAFDIAIGEVENIILSDQSQNELVISVLEPQEVISSSEHSMTSLGVAGDYSLNVIAAESVAAPISVTSDDIMTLEANESSSSTVVLTVDDNEQINSDESLSSLVSTTINEAERIVASENATLPLEFVIFDQINVTTHELLREIHSTKVLHPLKVGIETLQAKVRIRRKI